MKTRSTLTLLAVLALGSAQAANLTVFAASSLTDAFTEIGKAFDAKTGNTTTFNFAGSQVLRTQIAQGAPADVYASANSAQFDPLVTGGQVGSGQNFTQNRLTIITPLNDSKVSNLADLAKPGVQLVFAEPSVPVGAYARTTLTAIGKAGTYGKDFSAQVLKNVVSEESNVRQVAVKIQLGQGDAAIVYTTDVTPSLRASVRTIALPSRFNPLVSYPIGVVKASNNAAAAQAFVAYVQSPDGQKILKKWGFISPSN